MLSTVTLCVSERFLTYPDESDMFSKNRNLYSCRPLNNKCRGGFSLPRSGSSSSGKMTVDAKSARYSFRYSLDFPNLGHCIIINNKNFDRRTGCSFIHADIEGLILGWGREHSWKRHHGIFFFGLHQLYEETCCSTRKGWTLCVRVVFEE